MLVKTKTITIKHQQVGNLISAGTPVRTDDGFIGSVVYSRPGDIYGVELRASCDVREYHRSALVPAVSTSWVEHTV